MDGAGTLTTRLTRGIRDAVLDGRLRPGDKLPAQRALADELDVSRNVVVAAYDALSEEGYLEARQGAGTFVRTTIPTEGFHTELEPLDLDRPRVRLSKRSQRTSREIERARLRWAPGSERLELDFRYGPPAFRDVPLETLYRLLSRRYRRASKAALDYGDPAGAQALREAIGRHLARWRGVRCEATQVIVTRGTQEALRIAVGVLVDPGERVVLEDPGYLAARHTLAAHGARVLQGPVDRWGLSPKAIRSKPPRPRLVFVTPSHQFPTGVVMPLARRIEVLERAANVGAFVFEDDYDGELRHHGPAIPSLQSLDGGGCVLYAGSFSKSLFPSLRIGYLVVPTNLLPAFQAEKALSDAGGNTPLQLAVADFLEGGHLDRHLRRIRVANKARVAALIEAVRESFGQSAEVSGAGAGHHVVLWLRDLPHQAAAAIRTRARALGVGVYPLAPFYAKAPPRAGFLLGYAGLEPPQIREGIARLAEAVASSAYHG